MTKFFTGVGARIVSPYADGDRPGIGSATGISGREEGFVSCQGSDRMRMRPDSPDEDILFWGAKIYNWRATRTVYLSKGGGVEIS